MRIVVVVSMCDIKFEMKCIDLHFSNNQKLMGRLVGKVDEILDKKSTQRLCTSIRT